MSSVKVNQSKPRTPAQLAADEKRRKPKTENKKNLIIADEPTSIADDTNSNQSIISNVGITEQEVQVEPVVEPVAPKVLTELERLQLQYEEEERLEKEAMKKKKQERERHLAALKEQTELASKIPELRQKLTAVRDVEVQRKKEEIALAKLDFETKLAELNQELAVRETLLAEVATMTDDQVIECSKRKSPAPVAKAVRTEPVKERTAFPKRKSDTTTASAKTYNTDAPKVEGKLGGVKTFVPKSSVPVSNPDSKRKAPVKIDRDYTKILVDGEEVQHTSTQKGFEGGDMWKLKYRSATNDFLLMEIDGECVKDAFFVKKNKGTHAVGEHILPGAVFSTPNQLIVAHNSFFAPEKVQVETLVAVKVNRLIEKVSKTGKVSRERKWVGLTTLKDPDALVEVEVEKPVAKVAEPVGKVAVIVNRPMEPVE